MENLYDPKRKNYFYLALLLFLLGDIFYFLPLLFRKVAINFMFYLSPSLDTTELSDAASLMILFSMATIGSLLYLSGFLLFALSRNDLGFQRNLTLYGLITWFITDSLTSIWYGFTFNLVINTVLFILGMILILKLSADK